KEVAEGKGLYVFFFLPIRIENMIDHLALKVLFVPMDC
ncbi:unnamed protein product, partial [marine sediment metagenome]